MNQASETAVIRKVRKRLLPLLMLLYFVAYLDRVNIGFASLGMNDDIGLSNAAFGFGAGVFFLGYFLFEVPSNLALHHVGARLWIARIMGTWGALSMAMALVESPLAFHALRFCLGAAEAGFFPGVIYLLTRWFPAEYRVRAIAIFMAAAPVSTAIGSPLSGAIMLLDGTAGLHGWQWLFLLEGLPALLLVPVVLACLDDGPETARWLTHEERLLLVARLAGEAPAQPHGSVWAALADWRVLMLGVIYFGTSAGLYALGIWAPQLLARHGLDPLQTGLANAIPATLAILAMLWWARRSDMSGERELHVAGACIVAAVGLVLAGQAAGLVGCVGALILVNAGISAAKPPLWGIPNRFLGGARAAAGIAAINSIGNLGGFVGPTLVGWLEQRSGSFATGLAAIAAVLVISGAVAALMARLSPPAAASGEPAHEPFRTHK
ncbi:MAG: MFS transporter [Novosphingobium sp.]